MFWNIVKPLWETLVESKTKFTDNKTPTRAIESMMDITEFFLIELLLGRVIDINSILSASRNINLYSFPDSLKNNQSLRKILDGWFSSFSTAQEEFDKSKDVKEDELLSLLPLNSNIFRIHITFSAEDYFKFLYELRKMDHWESKKILLTELQKLRKYSPDMLEQYFKELDKDSTSKNMIDDMVSFESKFNEL